ncbi:MAG TPA: aldehyde dehydrogenase family protein [bacterium]|nr:aldehyde dehydrogenase family protein [bacterium]
MKASDNTYQFLIDNKWTDSESGESVDIISPHDNSVVGKLQTLTNDEIDKVFGSSYRAYLEWKELPLFERAQILNKAADIMEGKQEIMAKSLEEEIGKSKDSAKNEVKRSIDYIRFVVDAARNMTGEIFYGDAFEGFPKGSKIGLMSRVPLGVILAISPYNYPINLSITKIAPALIAGNTLVLKPATQGAIAALNMVDCFIEAGLPKGVMNTITGKSSKIGDYVVTHKRVALLAFTGSSETGRKIAKLTGGRIPLLMEMGGKDSSIVLGDADLEMTAEQLVKGGLSFCGQRCTAVKRVFVDPKVIDELAKLVVERAKKVKLGPLVNTAQKDFVVSLIEDAKKNGAKVNLEGKIDGNSIQPTVISNVTEKSKIFHEEQFGPVIPLSRMDDLDKAIEWINNSQYALQSSIYTKDIDKAFEIAEKLDTGSVQINGKSDRGPDNFPFIGIRDSGIGPAQGTKETIRAMTREKIIVLNRKL